MKIPDIIHYKDELLNDIDQAYGDVSPLLQKYFIELTAIAALIISGFLTLAGLYVSARLNPFLQDYAFQMLATFIAVAILSFVPIIFLNYQRAKCLKNCNKI